MFIAYFAPVFHCIPLENFLNRLQLLLNKKQMLIPPLSSMRKLAPVVVPGSRCQWCRSLGARCDPARVNIALAPLFPSLVSPLAGNDPPREWPLIETGALVLLHTSYIRRKARSYLVLLPADQLRHCVS